MIAKTSLTDFKETISSSSNSMPNSSSMSIKTSTKSNESKPKSIKEVSELISAFLLYLVKIFKCLNKTI